MDQSHSRDDVVGERVAGVTQGNSQSLLGDANITGGFADVGSSPWISSIRQHLAAETLAAGFDDFDAHALYSTAPRTLTQQISRLVFDNQCDGIRYVSKYGLDAECWALFDGRVITADDDEHEISVDDPDLQAAMHVFAPTCRPNQNSAATTMPPLREAGAARYTLLMLSTQEFLSLALPVAGDCFLY